MTKASQPSQGYYTQISDPVIEVDKTVGFDAEVSTIVRVQRRHQSFLCSYDVLLNVHFTDRSNGTHACREQARRMPN
ncbi:hypothetical protein GW17_00054916 [Ensete ventricosum]|nr:hypothetical protein GW17_00054916 [Ensete ventricosum]